MVRVAFRPVEYSSVAHGLLRLTASEIQCSLWRQRIVRTFRATQFHRAIAVECRMAVAQADQRDEPLHQRRVERCGDLAGREVVAVDVAAYAAPGQKFHVVVCAEQADVIDLGNAGNEKLDGTRDEVEGFIAAERIQVSAVHLVEIEVVGRGSSGLLALVPAAAMDFLDQAVDSLRRQQAGIALLIRADINDADAVVRVEDGDGVVRPDLHPFIERLSVGLKKGVQDQRRQREVVDPIDLASDLDLLLVVAMHLDENFHAERARLFRQLGDEGEGLGHHEAIGSRLLDGVTDGVEADGANAGRVKSLQNGAQVGLALRMQ